MGRLINWSSKALLSIADQGFVSASNFAVSVILARWLSAEQYGAYSLAYTLFLLLSGFHAALLIEPMSVLGPAHHLDDLRGYLSRMSLAHIGLTGGLAILGIAGAALFPSSALGPALTAMSLTLPLVLFFWLLRRAYYLETRPALAARCSLVYCLALAAGLGAARLTQWRAASMGFYFMAIASAASTLLGFIDLKLNLWPRRFDSSAFLRVVRGCWNFGKWLLPSALLFPLLSQIQIVLTGAYFGLAEAGVLRALQNPILPVVQVSIALGTLAIPILSRRFSEGPSSQVFRYGLLLTASMVALSLLYEGAIVATGNLWDRLLYRGLYSRYEYLMPAMGLVPVCTALLGGLTVVMRAIQRPDLIMTTHIVGGAVGFTSAVYMIRRWGLMGAVYGLVASQAVTAVAGAVLVFRARKRLLGESRLMMTASETGSL